MQQSSTRSTAESNMVDPMDDIFQQARGGSVAAIIQVLNDKLASAGVRTRAVFEHGVLQLLCEGAKIEQLEQAYLVDRIRQILESISPRSIRRVKINSRIVREQQLLWLEEINRDPEGQLLWSEEITLARPNILKRLFAPKPNARGRSPKPPLPAKPPSQLNREQQQFRRGIIGGATLSVLLLIAGAGFYYWYAQTRTQEQLPVTEATTAGETAEDPFVEAVRLAEQAASSGQTAATPAQWLDIAAQWQKASDLMGSVSPADERYPTAVDRTKRYRQNSELALKEAEKRRSQ